jgi:hypothetical protein
MNRPSMVSLFAAGLLATMAPAAAQTPPSITPVSFTNFRVVPSPATEIVRRVFSRARPGFAACAPASVYGTVSLRMATDANGQVASATARRTTFSGEQSAVTSCVLGVARRLRFPGSVQGTLDIEVNVVLGTADAGAAP